MGLFSRFFAKRLEKEAAAMARDGDLDEAAAAYRRAGNGAEASRLYLLLAEAELEVGPRLRLFARAIEAAPPGPSRAEAIKRRAMFLLAEAEAAPVLSPVVKSELVEIAPILLAQEDAANAVRAYRLLGDSKGLARAYERAGDIENLEALLEQDLAEGRRRVEERASLDDIAILLAGGQRKAALAKLRSRQADPEVSRQIANVVSRRPRMAPLAVRLRGESFSLVLHEEITIGRTEGITISSPEVSRAHVRLSQKDGHLIVRDLGSRNGTKIRGSRIEDAFAVEERAELELGPHVRISLTRGTTGWRLGIGAQTFLVTFGPLVLENWTLRASEEWFELSLDRGWLNGMETSGVIQLLTGDVLRRRSDETPASLEVESPP